MLNRIYDQQYLLLIDNILSNEEFNKISMSKHHGTNRLEHSLRVSYYSYRIVRRMGLDYEKTATAGLLHDFFITNNDKTIKESMTSVFKHSKISVDNASKYFDISNKEKNIIATHMFPLNIKPSKYIEGWIVSMVDKAVCLFEISKKCKYSSMLWMIFIINIFK